VAADGLVMAAQPGRDVAERRESFGFAVPVAVLTGEGQGPLEVIIGLLIPALTQVDGAEADQRVDLGVPVPGRAAEGSAACW